MLWVVTLYALGCPLQALVTAFCLDERTIASWLHRAGKHCEEVHQALVQQPMDLRQVQADEMRVRCQKRLVVWLAMALCVPTRLWLGAVLSQNRDKHLGRALAKIVRSCSVVGALLICTDGWKAYSDAFLKAFRLPEHTGKRGHPRLLPWPDFVLVQAAKWQEAGRTLGIRVCHCFGNWRQIVCLLSVEKVISTAYIERLNATFRQRLHSLCRRSRCLLRSECTLACATYLVGTLYNFCTPHQSLKQEKVERTPAMAAGLTQHIWSVGELFCYQVAPPPYVPPKRRGRKPSKIGAQIQEGSTHALTA